jgi:esterase/lipase superfamily enzyme
MGRRTHPAAALLLASLASAGCGNALMPTPVGFDRAGADPFASTTAAERTAEVRVFVASNRKPTGSARPAEHFGTERSQTMRLGTMTVGIGDGALGWPELAALSREDRRGSDPDVRLRSVDDYGGAWTGLRALDPEPGASTQAADRFAAAVEAAMQESGRREVYVFVHGFNTTVADNAAVSASLFHFLGRRGALVQFEWPSKGSVWDYHADKASAAASVRAFRHFIAEVGRRTKADRVHVLAHSAGAPVAVSALHELRLMSAGRPAESARADLRLGRLVLVAPDMDVGEFRDCVADGATALPERVTIYVSSRDKALDFAAWMSDFARLGQPLQVLKPEQVEFLEDDANVDIIDVAAAEAKVGSWVGHSYFHEDPWVSTDVLLALASGAHPVDRGLQRDGTRKVYAFGPEYPDRARAAAVRILSEAGTGARPDPPSRVDPTLTPSP